MMMQLGLGCVALGGRGCVASDVRLVREAIDLGITVFDTAAAYGGGASEHVLGRALRERRDEVVVATKGGFVFRERRPVEQWARRRAKSVKSAMSDRVPFHTGGGSGSRLYANQDFSPRRLRDSVHASLRRLRTDRIDVYLLHGPTVVVPELIDELADLVVTGDVVRFGVGADSVADADAWIAVEGVSVVEVGFGLLDPDAARSTFLLARRHERDVWVRGVLGGGLLGLVARNPSALAAHPKRPLIDALRSVASEAGIDLFQLAFGFLQAHSDDVSVALVGSGSRDHLRRNVELARAAPVNDELLRAVARITTKNNGSTWRH